MPLRRPEKWLQPLRHPLRNGYSLGIIRVLGHVLKYRSTPAAVKPTLKRVHLYLVTQRSHRQYRQFKKLGFPIGAGMVESACKWLVTPRLKGLEGDGVHQDLIICCIFVWLGLMGDLILCLLITH